MRLKNKNGLLAGIILSLIIGIPLVNFFLRKYRLNSDYRYTIAKVYDSKYLMYGKDAWYYFHYKGIKYKNSDPMDKRIEEGNWYLVKFSVENPKLSKLLFDYHVADSTIEVPDSGWLEIPEGM